jgi:protein gp37
MSSVNTGIEWTDRTWNPTTGCTKVSPGCAHCYAEAITRRFTNNFPNGFALTEYPERLQEPKRWHKPSRIFVNSMSDLFHEGVSLDFLKKVFEVMNDTPWHIYQILTKRHERLLDLAEKLHWSDNVWIGVSVENQNYTHRIDCLRQVPAKIRFLSCEPLLGELKLDLTNIHWVIVGGESGNGYRSLKKEWVKSIQEQCREANVAFFFKQWGGRTPKAGGRNLDGKIWDGMPDAWEKHLEVWNPNTIKLIHKFKYSA